VGFYSESQVTDFLMVALVLRRRGFLLLCWHQTCSSLRQAVLQVAFHAGNQVPENNFPRNEISGLIPWRYSPSVYLKLRNKSPTIGKLKKPVEG
jgi:hypothetical protein